MANNKILPSSFTEISVEHILNKYSRTPQIIYLTVLILIVIGFISLFFIHVDVSVKAQGMLKTSGERIYPKASGSGYVQYVNPALKENVQMTAGDTLIVIGREVWDEQLHAALQRTDELRVLLVDLKLLTNIPYKSIQGNYPANLIFQTAVYKQNYQLFCRRYQSSLQLFEAVQKNYEREKLLYSKGVIALADFEQAQDEYDQTIARLATLYNEQMNQWHLEQQKYQEEQTDIQSRINQLTIQKQELTVIAPVTGSIQQLNGLKIGNYVTEGEILMEISPEGTLYAECFVSPKDIGLIQVGQQAILQIDAFNYNEWGMLQAEVSDVAHDVILQEAMQQPFFKVFCLPQKDYLQLKNGYMGQLKKGMTFSVRFTVSRRTLFQLLYDKMDNWLNPNNITE